MSSVANAKLAYEDFEELVAGARWCRLAARGARPQRVLFASTSVKDPRYPPLMYVEALVGTDTVDTVPPATLEALHEGATLGATLQEEVPLARAQLDELAALGITMEAVTAEVLEEGVRKFAEPFRKLLATIADRRAQLSAPAGH